MRVVRWIAVFTVLVAGLSLAQGVQAAGNRPVAGVVVVDGRPVPGAVVKLMRAGEAPGTATLVASGTSGPGGAFALKSKGAGRYYLVASGGPLPRGLELAAALGSQWPGRVVIDELTTVATGFAAAQFLRAGRIGGPDPGLGNAMRMVRNIVDPGTGALSRFAISAPNGSRTQTVATINSLANMLTGCARSAARCADLLRLSGSGTTGTLQAMANIAANPSRNSARLFALQDGEARPALSTAPGSWLIALVFAGDGKQMRGPGNFFFDERGDLWITNNYQPAADPAKVCGGKTLLKLEPYSAGQVVREYRGGGLDGAGFGITRDAQQRIWVGNYGFKGTKCPETPGSNSVSLFTARGAAVSPATGYTNGTYSWPQGMNTAPDGTVWVANCGNDSLTQIPGGNPDLASSITGGLDKPFGLVQDPAGNTWVTSIGNDSVLAFRPDGSALPGSPFTGGSLRRPLGIASDTGGNKWVANSGKILLPCGDPVVPDPGASTLSAPSPGTITLITAAGQVSGFSGGGLSIPWGIAVDGSNNVWVANFAGSRVSHFCGIGATCPDGVAAGQPIAPAGLAFDGLQRNTAVQIDKSGNVWLANNWKRVPVQTNPGADSVVVIVGAAPPVADLAGVAGG